MKQFHKFLALIIFALFLGNTSLFAQSTTGLELVTSGTFDSTNLFGADDWTTTGTNNTAGDQNATSTENGQLYFNRGSSPFDGTASQAIATVVGERYLVSFDYRRVGGQNNNLRFRFTVYDTATGIGTPFVTEEIIPQSDVFVNHTYAFEAIGTSTTIYFNDETLGSGGSRDIAIDNVSAKKLVTPGGVSPDLSLWLKADTDAAPALWDDQSGNDHDVTAVAGQQPVLETNSLNFNPVMDFDGTNDQMTNSASPFASGVSNETNIFFVAREDARQENSIFGFNDGANNVNRYQSHHIYPDGTVYFDVGDSGTDDRVSGPSGLTVGEPHIAGYFNSVSGNNQAIDINGDVIASDITGESQSLSITRIGTSVSGGSQYFNGDIAEFIAYDTDNGATNKQQIQSYLAIKYGITLNNGTIAYLASDGSTVWPVDATYDSDIFGIAKDDDQGLDQQISKSVNTGSILTLSNDTNFTGANGTHVSLTDGQFLLIGNDAGSTTTTVATGVPATLDARHERQWKAANTGNVGVVNLSFEINPSSIRTYKLIINGAESAFAGTINGTSLEFTGVTLADGDIFSVGFTQEAPGDVAPGLALWLKADTGATPAQWDDQSGNTNNAVQATAGNQPSISTNAVNFNSAVTFDGLQTLATGDLLTTTNPITLSKNASIFVVSTRPAQIAGASTSFRSVFASDDEWSGGSINNGYWLGYGASNLEARTASFATDGLLSNIVTESNATSTTAAIISTINTNGSYEGFSNASSLGSITNASAATTGSFVYNIGGDPSILNTAVGEERFFLGDVTEIIAYNQTLSATEKQQVESYLAIKYGITLNNGTIAYKNSASTDVWTADMNYPADIFGIAKDDDQGLDQQISKSVNTGSILTLSNDTNFTGANGTHTSLTDGQFLVVGNDGNSGHPFDAVNTDLDTATYFERSAREWKAVNTGTVGAINLQFEGYDNTWVLLTRTTDGDFSATTGTTATALSATGTVATTLTGTTYFTLARLTTSIEFEAATANDVEATGGNLPNLLIDGTLNENTLIDVEINAAGTATIATDYTLGGATAPLPKTVSVDIPAGTYTSATPVSLSSLNIGDRLRASYPSVANGPTTQREESFVPKFSGTYQLTYAAETFSSDLIPNGLVRIGTTSGVTDGSFNVFDGSGSTTSDGDRIDATTPSRTYNVILIEGITYYVYSVAGGGTTMTNVTLNLEYLEPINFAITDEAIVEADETINITLSNPIAGLAIQEVTGGALIDTHAYTITNDDTATVSIDSPTVTEGNTGTTALTFTATLTGAVQDSFTVPYALTNGNTDSDDYAAFTDANITFPANSVSGATQTIVVTINGDEEVEADETLTMTLSAPSNTDVTLGTGAGTGTITNDDTATVTIAADADADEATASRAFTLTMSAAASTDVEVSYALTGTAADPADYADATTVNGTVTIAAGSTTGTIDLTVVDDALSEGTETVIATLTAATNNASVTASTAPATLNITDNDNSLTVSIAADADADEATASRAFTLTMSAAASTDVEVSYALTGTAADPADYADATTVNGTVTIAAGSTTGTIDLTVVDDALSEGTETVIATLTAATNNASVTASTAPATLNITDNDNSLTVSIAADADADEATASRAFTLTMSAAASTDVEVSYALTGTAADPADYADATTVNGTVTIAAGSTTGTIDLTVVDDALSEGTETVIATLTAATNNASVTASTAPATLNITDNDNSLTVSIAADADADEATASRAFTLTMSAAASTDVEVSYALTGTAADPADYADATTVNGTVTIAAGSTTGTIDLTVVDDALSEGTETVIATLTAATNNASVTASTAPATLNITDNDNSLTVSIAADADADEATASRAFTLTMSAAASTDVEVSYALTGTAADPADYADATTVNGTVTIAAGSTTGTIDLTVVDDALSEGTETVIATLTAATNNASVTASTAPATLNITDNDNSLTVSIAADADADEATASRAFTLTMSAAASTDVAISYALTGTAADPADYTDATTVNGTVTIAAGSTTGTIDLTVVDDMLVEAGETVIATLTAATNNTSVTATTTPATLNITDNDTAELSIAATTQASEDTTDGLFTITTTEQFSSATTVNFTVTGTATDGTDYAMIGSSVNFPANQNTVTIPIDISTDALFEGDETVIVTLDNTNNTAVTIAAAPNNAATITITDNDGITVELTASDAVASEVGGDTGEYTATLSSANNTGAAIVIPLVMSGTATDGTDFTSITQISIADGDTSGTVTLTVSTDALFEGDETATATLGTLPTGVTAGTSTTADVVISDDPANAVTVELTASDAVASEVGSDTGEYTATLSSANNTGAAIVIPLVMSGTATDGTDFTSITQISIADGDTSGTVTLTVSTDALFEGDETATATLGTLPTGVTAGTATTADVVISDDPANAVTVELTASDAVASEVGGDTGEYTATLSSANNTGAAIVIPLVMSGTATDGTDFTSITQISIADGDTSGTVTLTVSTDALFEGDETATASLGTLPMGVTAGTATTADVVISDDPANAVTVELTASDAVASEVGGDTGEYTATLSSANNTGATIVIPLVMSGTATDGTDFTSITQISIADGDTSGTVTLTVSTDALFEGDETATATLGTLPTGVTAGTATTADVVIGDDPADASSNVLTQIGNEGDSPNTIPSIVTVAQMQTILPGVTGLDTNNETAYQNYIDANPELFDAPATQTQVQDMVTAVNTSAGILEQIGEEGDDPNTVPSVVTVAELGTISPTVTGLIAGNETAYQEYIDANPELFDAPATQTQVQDMVSAVNTSAGILEQIGEEGDDPNTVPSVVTVAELGTISPTVTGLIAGNETAYQEYIDANPELFDAPATQTQVQDMVSAVNTSAGILEQIGEEGDDPNTVPSVVTVAELGTISPAVTGLEIGNEAAYQEYIDANPELFDDPATQTQVQDMVSAVNTSAGILEQIGEEGDDPNTVPSVVTVAELGTISPAVTGLEIGNEAAYQEYIDENPELFDAPATQTQIQELVDAVNTSEGVLTQIGQEGDDPDTVPSVVTVAQLETISPEITGLENGNEEAYQEYIDENPELFDAPATQTQIQELVDAVNTSEGVLTQIGQEGDDPDTVPSVVTVAQLETISPEITGLENGNEEAYQEYIDENPELFDAPATQTQIQELVDAVNTSEGVLTQIGQEGDDPDTVPSVVTVAQLETISPEITGLENGNEEAYQEYIDENPELFDAPATQTQIQELVDAVNTSEGVLTQIGQEGDDPDTVPSVVTVAQLETISPEITGLENGNEESYQEYIDANPELFDAPATIQQVQDMVEMVNTSQEVLTQIGNEGDNPNVISSMVTIAQLETISPELTDLVAENETLYQEYIDENPDLIDAPATQTQIQDMVIAVNTAADGTNSNTTITATSPIAADGNTPSTIVVQLADTLGDLLSTGGDQVTLTSTGSATQVGTVVDNNDGTYTAEFINLVGETVIIFGTVNGKPITNTASVEFLTDTDNDGDPDITDLDDDNDGQSDADETACGSDPLDTSSTSADNDGDNLPNCTDPDDDNDGTPDATDDDDDNDGQSDADEIACGTDPNDSTDFATDTDGDNIPDCVDEDDDGDGQSDADEVACGSDPLDKTSVSADADGDNLPNCSDPDDDNDGIADVLDDDDDNDGQSDEDEIACGSDPLDPQSLAFDTDGDGIPDCTDEDDDGDGQSDVDEATCGSDPLDGTSVSFDNDLDGIPNCADDDNDNDGILDVFDDDNDGDGQSNIDEIACGSDPANSSDTALDTDGDGIPDCQDDDDDNDGTPDEEDAFPLDETEDTDTDGDGEGDNSDEDADNDGILDEDDLEPLLPYDPDADDDMDGIPNYLEDYNGDGNPYNDDSDGDGIADFLEPYDPDADYDGDGVANRFEDTNNDGDLLNDDCDEDGVPDFIDTDPCGAISAGAFTPNGDGINDTWTILGIEGYPFNTVKVYNRYGNEVFGARGYQNDWIGGYQDSGDKLPPGSYYYQVNLGDGSPPIDGWLFINY